MKACIPYLSQEFPPGEIWGRFIFGITSDQNGVIADLRVMSSDLGETPLSLECAVNAAMS